MKASDRYLLHTIDAATPDGMPHHLHAYAFLRALFIICSHVAAFVLGGVYGSLP